MSFRHPQGIPPGTGPARCGSAASINVGGVTVTGITTTFTSGTIFVTFTIAGAGFCYAYSGSASIRVVAATGKDGVKFVPLPGPTSIRVDVPWYCYVASLILTPIATIVLAVVDALLDSAINALITIFTSLALFDASVPVPTLPTGIVTGARISSEGLILTSAPKIAVPPPRPPFLSTSTRWESLRTEVLQSLARPAMGCPDENAVSSEQRRWMRCTTTITSGGYGHPLSAAWAIEDTATHAQVALVGPDGIARIQVPVSYESFGGVATTTRTVAIGYRISDGGTTCALTNDPDDGNYNLLLQADTTNCPGTLHEQVSVFIAMRGHIVTRPPGVEDCLLRWSERIPAFDVLDLPRPAELAPRSDAYRWATLAMQLSQTDDETARLMARDLALLVGAIRSEIAGLEH